MTRQLFLSVRQAQTVAHVPCIRHHLIVALAGRRGAGLRLSHLMACEPRMLQRLLGTQPLQGVFSQQIPYEALGRRGHGIRDLVHSPADLVEENNRLSVVEGVAPNQHGVDHDPQGPEVGTTPRVTSPGRQDLWADISRAAMLVGQEV